MDEWQEKKGPACSMPTSQEAAHFEIITGDLSVRAKRVLAKLGVKDVVALQQLTPNDLIQEWSCGKTTGAEIEAVQSKLRDQNEKAPPQVMVDDLDFDDAPREIFHAVQSKLSVRGAHVLEDLGVDSLKAFMKLDRVQLLKCRNCGRKSTDEILKLQSGIAGFARELVYEYRDFMPEQILAAPCLVGITTSQTNTDKAKGVFADIENPSPWLTEWVRGLSRSNKEMHAFMLRKGMVGLAPMTLERVGEHVGGVSRERARQMEAAVEKRAIPRFQQHRLRPLIDTAAAIVKQRGGMVRLEELTKAVLCKGTDGDQLIFATELLAFFSTLQIWKDAGLLLQKDGIVKNGDSQPHIQRLADMIMDVASTAADERYPNELWSIDRQSLKKVLLESAATKSDIFSLNDISDALLDAVLRKCRKRLKAHKDRVYSVGLWRLRFGNISQMLDTLLKHIGKPAHFSEVAEHASKWRPGFSERNAHATLDRSNNALLWDRGTFVHKDNVVIPLSLIHDVEDWLIEVLREDMPFVSINGAFLHFRTRCERVGLPSEVALYTCLRQSAHPELEYPRYPRVYLKMKFTQHIPMVVIFEDFLREAGGPVSQQEVREFGIEKIFLKDFQFSQLSQQVSNVVRTNDWGYIHLDNSDLSLESIKPLIDYTQEILTREEHCSVDKIYRDKQVTCKSAGIDGPVMLYSAFQCFAPELFSLDGYPRVVRNYDGEKKSRNTIRERVLDFIRDSGKPCPYEVLEKRFVEQLGYKEQHVYSIVREPDVCLYHSGCAIHYQTLAWDEAKQHALESVALHIYNDAVRAGKYFGRISYLGESTNLPQLPPGLYWSRTMITDLLAKGGQYLVLGSSREAFLPRDNDQNLRTFEDLVGKLLNQEWGGAANLVVFQRVLLEEGIIKKHLTPNMLGSGQLVVIKNEEIILKELLIDAQRP